MCKKKFTLPLYNFTRIKYNGVQHHLRAGLAARCGAVPMRHWEQGSEP
jgi:hypothetical protein